MMTPLGKLLKQSDCMSYSALDSSQSEFTSTENWWKSQFNSTNPFQKVLYTL